VERLGPTAIDEGVVLYMHANFVGTSQQVATDVTNFASVEGPCGGSEDQGPTWDNCISSIRLLPGWGATLYGDKDFKGALLVVTADIPDLKALSGSCSGSYNDCVSSIKVYRK
jgi:hypothetical protein